MQVNLALSLHAQWARRGAKLFVLKTVAHTFALRLDRSWSGHRWAHYNFGIV
jgi:hypothetical protein